MDVHDIVANVRRRKEAEAVQNALDLRQMQQKDYAFKRLREDLTREFEQQIEGLNQQLSTNITKKVEEDKTTLYRDGSSKTLTISFVPSFHHVAFNFDGGSIFKRSLTVELEGNRVDLRVRTRTGLPFYYRREDGSVVKPDAIGSQICGLL